MNDSLRETLERVHELSARVGKHQQIRVLHWVRTLLAQPTSNGTWMRNVVAYATALLQMLQRGVLDAPFDKLPPQGPLPTLSRHALHSTARITTTPSCGDLRTRATSSSQRQRQAVNNQSETISPKREKRTQSQHVQTRESEEQWEWQRVWKGAFEQMRSDLEAKAKQTCAMELELKELRAVLSGTEKALERERRGKEELQAHHDAQLRNLRAVHDLELQALKSEHRKKIQEVTLQNEHELQRRKREAQIHSHMRTDDASDAGAAFNAQSESYGDFLEYIDAFHMATLELTEKEHIK